MFEKFNKLRDIIYDIRTDPNITDLSNINEYIAILNANLHDADHQLKSILAHIQDKKH